jgi:hypothetical protein
MNTREAISTAARRVSIVQQGRDYVLHTWSERYRSTWVSHSMNRPSAMAAAYEAKVRTALELLGVEDAGEIANMTCCDGGPRPDWRKVVRKLAAEGR